MVAPIPLSPQALEVARIIRASTHISPNSRKGLRDFPSFLKWIHFQAHDLPYEIRAITLGLDWASSSGRLCTNAELWLRGLTAWRVVNLISAMVADGCQVMGDVPSWLNSRATMEGVII